MPEIRAEGEAIAFHLAIGGVEGYAQLVIRCDPDGSVRASLARVESRHAC